MPDEEFEHLDAATSEGSSLQESVPAKSVHDVEGTSANAPMRTQPDALTESSENAQMENTQVENTQVGNTPIENIADTEALQTTATTTFHLLPDVFALMRLPVQIQRLPDFVWQSSFYTISRSSDEISLVCEERLVVRNLDHYGLGNFARIDGNWRILRLGVMDLSLVGVAARFAGVLAEAGVNINIISTYDTDYVMVKQGKLARALDALREAGYTINSIAQM